MAFIVLFALVHDFAFASWPCFIRVQEWIFPPTKTWIGGRTEKLIRTKFSWLSLASFFYCSICCLFYLGNWKIYFSSLCDLVSWYNCTTGYFIVVLFAFFNLPRHFCPYLSFLNVLVLNVYSLSLVLWL